MNELTKTVMVAVADGDPSQLPGFRSHSSASSKAWDPYILTQERVPVRMMYRIVGTAGVILETSDIPFSRTITFASILVPDACFPAV